jgi:hypothetical protein
MVSPDRDWAAGVAGASRSANAVPSNAATLVPLSASTTCTCAGVTACFAKLVRCSS